MTDPDKTLRLARKALRGGHRALAAKLYALLLTGDSQPNWEEGW